MARENKRARDEHRFGKPSRLADVILATIGRSKWGCPFGSDRDIPAQIENFSPIIDRLRESLSSCKVFMTSNVCRVYWDSAKDDWDYLEDFPNSVPPFRNFFIESVNPGTMVVESGNRTSETTWCPDQFGAMFWADECDGLDFETFNKYKDVDCRDNRISFKDAMNDCTPIYIKEARWDVRCVIVGLRGGVLGFMPIHMRIPVGENGRILSQPMVYISSISDAQEAREAGSMFHSLIKPLLLSVSFMHCKNVVTEGVEPDRQVNRERRKAGLKPFVRYHTINIEPMKKTLKTEGNIETEGLKRALHICRGHFSTYSEEKPLFGRVAGTFWVPAHVRGSAKQGVVISDYKVSPGLPNNPE